VTARVEQGLVRLDASLSSWVPGAERLDGDAPRLVVDQRFEKGSGRESL
jgi:hypothetical protein